MDYKLIELDEVKNMLKENLPFNMTNYGKLIRSRIGILLLKAHNICITKEHLSILSATELIHNASLLHDDILDNETERRNSQTIQISEGKRKSLLYGNLVLTNAITELLKIGSNEIINIFNNTLNDMCKGELLQQSQLGTIQRIEEYLTKTELKTASLFKTCIKALTRITPNLPTELVNFGLNYGIAFQIQNDLDNIYTTRSDIKNGIYTAPVIFSNSINIEKVGIEKTLSLRDNYIDMAIKAISNIDESIYKKELIRIVQCLKISDKNITNLENNTQQ